MIHKYVLCEENTELTTVVRDTYSNTWTSKFFKKKLTNIF
jgi:hypothetical protein